MTRALPARVPVPSVKIVFGQEVPLSSTTVDLSRVWSHYVVIISVCGATGAILVVMVGGGTGVGAGVDVVAWYCVLVEAEDEGP